MNLHPESDMDHSLIWVWMREKKEVYFEKKTFLQQLYKQCDPNDSNECTKPTHFKCALTTQNQNKQIRIDMHINVEECTMETDQVAKSDNIDCKFKGKEEQEVKLTVEPISVSAS